MVEGVGHQRNEQTSMSILAPMLVCYYGVLVKSRVAGVFKKRLFFEQCEKDYTFALYTGIVVCR